jgi:hypothetical protein
MLICGKEEAVCLNQIGKGDRMLADFGNWLRTLPPTLATVLAVGLAATLSIVCLVAVHFLVPHRLRSLHNDVAGFILAIAGVIYAVLLAFIAIAVWQSYAAAGALVQSEANIVDDMYRGTVNLPPDVALELRQGLYTYTEVVVHKEWAHMTDSRLTGLQGWLILDRVHLDLTALHPKDAPTLAAQTTMFDLLDRLYDVRRERFTAAYSSLPVILWWNVLAGAMILIVFSSLFGVPRLIMHAVMMGLLGGSIGLVLMLIVLLDNPFDGQSQVSVQPFVWLSRAVEMMDYPHP